MWTEAWTEALCAPAAALAAVLAVAGAASAQTGSATVVADPERTTVTCIKPGLLLTFPLSAARTRLDDADYQRLLDLIDAFLAAHADAADLGRAIAPDDDPLAAELCDFARTRVAP